MRSLVFPEDGLDLLSNHEYWLFPSDTGILAMLIIDIPEGDVGGVVLDQPQICATRDGCGKVETKISLLCLSFAR
jgi:hypothetical protein